MSFLFERNFDDEAEAEAAARDIVPAAALSPAEIARLHSDAFDAGRTEGHAAGYEEGFSTAKAEFDASLEAALSASLAALVPQINALSDALTAHAQAREHDLVQLTGYLAERLLPEITERFAPRRIHAFCKRALMMSEGSSGLTLTVAPELLADIQAAFAALSPDCRLTITADPSFERSQARAQWQGGGAETSGAALARELMSLIHELSPDPVGAQQEALP